VHPLRASFSHSLAFSCAIMLDTNECRRQKREGAQWSDRAPFISVGVNWSVSPYCASLILLLSARAINPGERTPLHFP